MNDLLDYLMERVQYADDNDLIITLSKWLTECVSKLSESNNKFDSKTISIPLDNMVKYILNPSDHQRKIIKKDRKSLWKLYDSSSGDFQNVIRVALYLMYPPDEESLDGNKDELIGTMYYDLKNICESLAIDFLDSMISKYH